MLNQVGRFSCQEIFSCGPSDGICIHLHCHCSVTYYVVPQNNAVTTDNRWDQRTSAVTPDEDVFYLVAFLRSALDNGEETQSLDYLSNQNRQILRFCEDAGIKVKHYLPHYTTEQQWMDHFGEKWSQFYYNKILFDPRHILATGQRIFIPSFASSSSSSSNSVATW